MAQDRKGLLIVDDTEIDRVILKSILTSEFDITEANNGNFAIEYLTRQADKLDAVLLDICMSPIDGFDVLRYMKDKNITDIPVFLITAEPTRENVERALQYNVTGFIGKPFDKDDILRRIRSRLGIPPFYDLQKLQINETMRYIADLESFYQQCLANLGKDDAHYRTMKDLMEIMLNHYARTSRAPKLTVENIRLIAWAAYFCDIGELFIPDKRMQMLDGRSMVKDQQKNHVELGSAMIRLNRAPNCAYFVDLCSDMCLHHHERYDGTGYPSHVSGDNISIYNQMCRLLDEFDSMRSKFYGDKAKPVSFIIKRLTGEEGAMVSQEVLSLLEDCEKEFFNYFMKRDSQAAN